MFFAHDSPASRVVLNSCLVLLAGAVATFFIRLYSIRQRFQSMQKEGLVSG